MSRVLGRICHHCRNVLAAVGNFVVRQRLALFNPNAFVLLIVRRLGQFRRVQMSDDGEHAGRFFGRCRINCDDRSFGNRTRHHKGVSEVRQTEFRRIFSRARNFEVTVDAAHRRTHRFRRNWRAHINLSGVIGRSRTRLPVA